MIRLHDTTLVVVDSTLLARAIESLQILSRCLNGAYDSFGSSWHDDQKILDAEAVANELRALMVGLL